MSPPLVLPKRTLNNSSERSFSIPTFHDENIASSKDICDNDNKALEDICIYAQDGSILEILNRPSNDNLHDVLSFVNESFSNADDKATNDTDMTMPLENVLTLNKDANGMIIHLNI